MRPKLFFHLTFMFLAIVCLAHSSHAITQFGQNPFYAPGVNSPAEMKAMFMQQEKDVRLGLKKAGHMDIADDFFAQLPDAEVMEKQYAKGQYLPWVFYRKKGKGPVRIDKDVKWEADTPFSAYEFSIDSSGKRYTFVVPGICGNLALKSVAPAPVKAAVPPPAPPKQPEAPAVAEEVVEEGFPYPIIADVGYLYQIDPAHHLLFRIGIEHAYTDNFSVIGMVGVAPKVSGDESATAFILDVFANYNWTKWYAGVGLGAWITDGDSDIDHEDSDLDIIINVGREIYEKPDSFTVDLFAEFRSGVDELDDIDLYGRIGAGLRFRF